MKTSDIRGGQGRPLDARPSTGRAFVLHPVRRDPTGTANGTSRSPEAQLDEAVGLARAIDLDILSADLVPVVRPAPGTFFGSGTVDQVKAKVAEVGEGGSTPIVVVDHALSPIQQRNLERAWKAKVIDRTGIILEIFGARARTREGQLQVELAALSYQRSRLVRSWTHLERQRGGFGFLGGPGESQLEMDRRLILDRIARIKRDLEDVRRTRGLHRRARERVPYPVIALVGYTNAGKSTLFNRLAGADVFAKDLLFATLDPTMRAVDLPSGRRVILSDTVGFIADLPTHLVAAFRATLEEVQAADVILHVRDIAHPDTEAQKADVLHVLADLDIDSEEDERIIEVLNKVDLLDPETALLVEQQVRRAKGRAVAISALTGDGFDRLSASIDALVTRHREVLDVAVDLGDGAALAWLYEHGEVLSRADDEQAAHLRLSLDTADRARFEHRFPAYRVASPS